MIFLNKGKYDDTRIVKNRTLKKMLKPQWDTMEKMPPIMKGFFGAGDWEFKGSLRILHLKRFYKVQNSWQDIQEMHTD